MCPHPLRFTRRRRKRGFVAVNERSDRLRFTFGMRRRRDLLIGLSEETNTIAPAKL
jgi:hypothetical protein